tara:strand:- start:11865 stop:12026 length:162 start_codon:yes stop_codon:yes gene_type:complete
MFDVTTFYFVSIGSACLISSIFFYYTYKNQIRYSDNEVERINIEMRLNNDLIV